MPYSFVVIVTITPIYLAQPPYLFNTRQQGLTFIGPLIGSLIGGLLCGRLTDYLSCYLCKRNQGVFEPEMRLPMTTLPMLVTVPGLIMFGVGLDNGYHWIVIVIGSSLVATGLSAIPSTLQSYLLDSYYAISLDIFTVRWFLLPTLLSHCRIE